jgi:hypothetical protein
VPRISKKKAPLANNAWQPLALYDHQREVVIAYKDEDIRRFFLAWHRRAGKDVFGLDFARERLLERVGNYWHLFPFHVQARRAIWKGIDARTGQRFIDRAFPKSMRASENDTEMSITFKNGSVWQMLGSDKYDNAVGANPAGILFSEWALCNPMAWDYFRPILVENKGWAAFITTFRGRNHAWRQYKQIESAPGWFANIRTIEQTRRNDGSFIVTKEDVEKEIREGMSPQLARQEFYCDPDAATAGAIFARQSDRLMGLEPIAALPTNRVIRVAWGMVEEGIAAVVFVDNRVIGVHPFAETNLVDCIQAVTRRHPNVQMIHHAINPDTALFSSLDGFGVVTAPLTHDPHMKDGNTAAMLNTCEAIGTARDMLADFAMNYAPYRQNNGENEYVDIYPAMSEAVAVMNTAQLLAKDRPRKKLVYASDRGVI